MRTVYALAALLSLAAFEAAAMDVVRLRNGRAIEGRVVEEGREHIVLEIEDGRLRLNRAEIFVIERDLEKGDWEIQMRRLARQEALRIARMVEAEMTAEGEPEKVAEEVAEAPQVAAGEAEADPEAERQARLARLMEDLESVDAETRDAAKQVLEREGRAALVLLTAALSHQNPFVRTFAAEQLGRLRARESVRELLVALRSSVPEEGRVTAWQRPFVEATVASLRALTGQDFGLRPSAYSSQRHAVEDWVWWWEGVPPEDDPGAPPLGAYAEWTPLVGERALDERSPDYLRRLHEARGLGERVFSYRAPAMHDGDE